LQTSNYSKYKYDSIISITPVNYYLMAVMNKRLLISESRDDSNRCIPCRGKPDQHDTYVSHTSTYTPGVRFLRAVPVCGNLLRSHQQQWIEPLLLRKRAPDTIPSAPADRCMGPYPVSLLSQPLK
jgi:hypothetical protein